MGQIISREGMAIVVDPLTGRARRRREGSVEWRPGRNRPRYRSKLEAAWADVLHVRHPGAWRYEAIRLRLADRTWYTPDFLAWTTEHVVLYEVKGRWIKNRRDGLTRLKIAASLYPWLPMVLVTRERGQWVETQLRY